MMKVKKVVFVVLIINCFLIACSKSTDSSTVKEHVEKNSENSKQKKVNKEKNNKEKNTWNKKKGEQSQNKVNGQEESMSDTQKSILQVYFSNDDATAFVSEEVQIDALTPEAVLNALISKGAVAADVQILAFNTVTVDNKPSVEIDFNPTFSTFVTNMGSTGEYFAIGSVCNTFLNAYNCEQIKITVEGQTLTTGHAEYPGYLTAFE